MSDTAKYWLISYYCMGSSEHFGECVHEGSLGAWRIAQMEFKDGPYILLAAHELSKEEYDRLNGWIG